jgi:hypothetical protein
MSDPVFGIVGDDVAFEDNLSGAGFSQDEAESALLGVDFELHSRKPTPESEQIPSRMKWREVSP